jgi:acetolactate synthase-1/2/3 large subunit
MNGAELLAEILRREGTEFLACYPRNPLIEACAKLGIRPILPRQERVGIGLADGFTRVRRGRANGVFAAQAGPGIENAFPGVTQAYSENVPILVIPAAASLNRQYTRPVFSAVDNYARITKWSARAHDVQFLPDLMRRAYHALRTGKGGPVLVEVPDEVWKADYRGELRYAPQRVYRGGPDPDAVREAANMLTAAENPVLFAGQGVLYAGATAELVELAMLLPAPVLTTNPGKSAFPENHPLSLGASTRSGPRPLFDYLKRADVVFAVGSSLTETSFGPGVPHGPKIIHSTNDPGDINKDYAVDHAVIGDAKLVLRALIEEVTRARGGKAGRDAKALSEEVLAAKAAWREEWMEQLAADTVPINPYRVVHDLLNAVDRDNTIITHDSGSPREQLLPFWECTAPGGYMGWGKSTQLGYGLGIIMGAKLAAPGKLCINIMGDAAIGMTGMDLETAARNRIGILTIVFNNGVMGAERDVLIVSDEKFGAMTVGGNYTKVADGLGVAAERVETPDAFIPALKRAIETTASGQPCLIECMTAEVNRFSRYG